MLKKPKKSLAQNFLIDKNICKKILAQTIIKNKIVVEIGPGRGFLTDLIIEKNPKKLILIEKDNKLSEYLKIKYSDKKNVEIINKDILKYNLFDHKNLTFISNLPYNIATRIILCLFNYSSYIDEMIFMIQKEVSIKFDYNIFNMNKYKFLNNLFCNYQRCFDISPNVFKPKPKVISTVVKFKFKNNKINLKKMNTFIEKIFKNKRKKIKSKIQINDKNNYLNEILNKRVDQLKLNELLSIYNSF